MGKRLRSPANLEEYGRAAAGGLRRAKAAWTAALRSPLASNKEASLNQSSAAATSSAGGGAMDGVGGERREGRVPLREVVSDCVRRWFQDALKEAKAGDTAMQVLVGQMYHSGYGVAKNEQKANAWITKASRYRSSVWKVSEKRPGYNASDSDSDEEKDNMNS